MLLLVPLRGGSLHVLVVLMLLSEKVSVRDRRLMIGEHYWSSDHAAERWGAHRRIHYLLVVVAWAIVTVIESWGAMASVG